MADDGLIKKIEGIKDKVQEKIKKPRPEDGQVEKISTPEAEVMPEKSATPEVVPKMPPEGRGEEGAGTASSTILPPKSQAQKERETKIEKILEEGLDNIYINMPPESQKKFKKEGEEAAKKISDIFESGKIKVKKIIELIRNWLSNIPGVNKFFLEQEAKIKTDKIMKNTKHDIGK